jgi:Fic family protein
MQALETALDLLKQLDALRPLSADQEERIWQKFRLDWNYHSNNLEGNSLTYGETKSLLLHGITARGKSLLDHLQITGHQDAIEEIEEAVKRQRPLTESLLRSWHVLILKEPYYVDAKTEDGQPVRKMIEVGKYKTLPNHVVTATGEIFHFAEPIDVPARMQLLVDEVNQRQQTPYDGILHAAKVHYDFVRIHPFDDGNGRIARILMNLVLMQHSLPPAIIKTNAKEEYFSALKQADGGQFEQFAEYIAERVCESLRIMVAGAKGESIDEPDDLDKSIAILKGTLLEKQGGTPPPQRSHELLTSWLSDVFSPLLGKFITTNQKFYEFYTSHTISGNIDDRKLTGDINHDLEYLGLVNLNDASSMFYVANFSGLKIPGLSKHESSYTSSFSIEFGPVSYKLDFSAGNTHHLRYDEKIQPDQLTKMMLALGNLHLQHLKQRQNQSSNPA